MTHKSVYEKLEFGKVLTYISNYSVTEKGKSRVLSLSPLAKLEDIKDKGQLITEAKEVLTKLASPPLDYLPDLDNILSQSSIEGALLESKKILDVLKLAIISRNLFQFFRDNTDDNSFLRALSKYLFVDKAFENYVQRIINENGELKDNASPKLYEIRKEISSRREDLIRSVNKLVKQLKEDNLVREDYVTLRDGRIVLPIKVEHKRHIRGFIHSESSTGQTVYIEPEETLELNNDIISLTFAEKREIERILKEVTKRIGEISNELKATLEAVTEIDLIFSCAKYSIEILGCFPTIENSIPINIDNARHPILLKKFGREKTIPLTVNVDDQNVILITGPNAGGKTVVLKTIGLLHLMINSGLHVPCNSDSNFHFFKSILVDIGDEQSLEDDLSTFSSHLSNINFIMNSASSDSLVLLDEIGTGTDPAEGSALAAGILVHLKNKRALIFATTHHGNLKIIAHDLPGFENTAMEFDHKNLKPTYKFKQGIPGSSYAFEIAKRIGLDDDLMLTAQSYLDSNKSNIESFLIKLEEKSQELEDQLRKAESENVKLTGLSNYYKENLDKLNKEKKEIIKKAKSEAEDYLKDLNKRFEKIIKDLKESNANKDVIKSSQVIIKELKEKNKSIFSETLDIQADNESLIVGDYVQIKNTHTTGEIIELSKDKALLISGGLKIQVSLGDLIKTKRESKIQDNFVKLSIANPSHRLDIRGEKPEEAEFEVIKFIDDAYVSGLTRVEILHGKGTGVLKKLVKEILKSHDKVKDFRFAPVDMGGDGITIAELK
jgi:DNA mismatch repair protein MutS2